MNIEKYITAFNEFWCFFDQVLLIDDKDYSIIALTDFYLINEDWDLHTISRLLNPNTKIKKIRINYIYYEYNYNFICELLKKLYNSYILWKEFSKKVKIKYKWEPRELEPFLLKEVRKLKKEDLKKILESEWNYVLHINNDTQTGYTIKLVSG